MWHPRSCLALGGGRWSHGDTWRPRSQPKPEGRRWSHGDTWHSWSCPAPGGGCRSCGDTWAPPELPCARRWAPVAVTHGGPGAALHWEGGAGAVMTHGGLGSTLNQGAGTTPPPPLPHPSACGQGMVVSVTPLHNPHRMITRGKTGFKVVPGRLVLTVETSSPALSLIPSSASAALVDPHWRAAMEDEYGALINNGTWELVPRSQGSNVVTGKWVFTHKLCADGTLDRYKARWVLQGFTQHPGVEYDETFLHGTLFESLLVLAYGLHRPCSP
jgi:hypothetical protein